MDLRVVLASNMRRLRSERGLSQCRLAVEAGLDRSYLSRLENARNSTTLELLAKLADVLGVKPAELLTPTEPRHDCATSETCKSQSPRRGSAS
jgi:transcriptional regulator with XRE-family HTH domain